MEPARAARLKCDSCLIEIERDAVEREGKSYCCDGCAAGGPCVC